MADKNLETGITESTTMDAADLLYAVVGANSRRVKRSNLFNPTVANQGVFGSTGGSNTGSNAASAFDLAWTLNTSGSPDVFALRVTDTARGANTRLLNLYGGASGTTSQFSVDRSGVIRSAQAGNATIMIEGGFANYGMGFDGSGNGTFFINTFKRATIGLHAQLTDTGSYSWVNGSDATATRDTSVSKQAAGVVQVGSGGTLNANGTIAYAWSHWNGQARVSTQFDKTTSTVLADVTGLTATLVAGHTYRFSAYVPITADGTGGYKLAMGGTVTPTSIIYNIGAVNNGSGLFTITSKQTALAGSSGAATGTDILAKLEGTITVTTGGTLTVQFAQNASNGTSSVLVGASLMVWEFP